MIDEEFNLSRIYWHEISPKRLARWIDRLQDKKLQVIILPTSEKTCDFIIRNIFQITAQKPKKS
ncbi:MAG: hypothetical protein AABY22_32770 [Nanoarchaeota archaeon]